MKTLIPHNELLLVGPAIVVHSCGLALSVRDGWTYRRLCVQEHTSRAARMRVFTALMLGLMSTRAHRNVFGNSDGC